MRRGEELVRLHYSIVMRMLPHSEGEGLLLLQKLIDVQACPESADLQTNPASYSSAIGGRREAGRLLVSSLHSHIKTTWVQTASAVPKGAWWPALDGPVLGAHKLCVFGMQRKAL